MSRQRGGVYEDQPDLARQPGGIGCGIPVNHLCPAVAGGGGMTKDEALDLALEALEVGQTAVTMFNLVPKPHLTKAITAIKQARSAPITKDELTEPLGCVVVRPLVANRATPPGGRQSEDCLTAAQEDIQRLSALVRAQQITIDKLEQGEPVTERNVT